MLFHSGVFLFGFLPLALGGFFLAGRLGRQPAGLWLVAASLAFYGWWNPAFLAALLLSVVFNYVVSVVIGRLDARPVMQCWALAAAIAVNLGALVYFKYLFALVGLLRGFGIDMAFDPVVLPLGISFFTFTQIGYLVDVNQGTAKERGLLNYLLFVTFFPHLIAGPILHNREIMPQFAEAATFRPSGRNLSVGVTIFVMGMLKKCLLADPLSATVAAGFADPAGLAAPAAWLTALSYSLQLYFDFSGYSDMAIGLARMFNVRFPINFNSPYKAASVIEYWQRWHMTLTRYLTLLLYNPIALAITRWRTARGLPVNRGALARPSGFAAMVVAPTFATMGLAGIWHGAGLQFVIFGLLHATYLCVNHAWRILFPQAREEAPRRWRHAGSVLLTYLAVLVGAIFFRAPSAGVAVDLLRAMAGMNGAGAWPALPDLAWLGVLYGVVWGLPNTQEIVARAEPTLGRIRPACPAWLQWQPTAPWAVAAGLGALAGLLTLGSAAEFLYFQF